MAPVEMRNTTALIGGLVATGVVEQILLWILLSVLILVVVVAVLMTITLLVLARTEAAMGLEIIVPTAVMERQIAAAVVAVAVITE